MLIGRKEEMRILERLYHSKKFEFLVLYGRRRVGKTTLLNAFRESHHCIFYSAQEKNDALNLSAFSATVQTALGGDLLAPFRSWDDALRFIPEHTNKGRTVLIIDEFPFLASENPSIKSTFQHMIDHSWKNLNLFLILCGSNISFMEDEVMGYKSPLYGRSTAQYELLPLDYQQSSSFFERYTPEQKLTAYCVLGGVPRYLEEFDDHRSLRENIESKILDSSAFLHEEPQTLLRMEVREPARYNSILEAVADGVNKNNRIADRLKDEQTTLNKYLNTLKNLRLIRKRVPCGEKEGSKKGIYEIADPFFSFWYRFEFANRNRYDLIGNTAASAEIMEQMNDYCGLIFEQICEQYMRRLSQKGKLPFSPHYLGKWWGNNPYLKSQDDVDILVMNKDMTEGILCECKYKNKLFRIEDFMNLKNARHAFPQMKKVYYYLFSKSGFDKKILQLAAEESVRLITPKDLLE